MLKEYWKNIPLKEFKPLFPLNFKFFKGVLKGSRLFLTPFLSGRGRRHIYLSINAGYDNLQNGKLL